MKEINKVNSEYFGEIVCIADDNKEPLFWAKKEKMRFLSKKERSVMIALNLYVYDKEFNSLYDKDDVIQVNKAIKRVYDIFMLDCADIDSIFLHEYNLNREEWDLEYEIKSLSDLYKSIEVIQVDILKNTYVINFLLDGEEWSLVKGCEEGIKGYYYLNPRNEAPFAKMEW